MVDFPTLLLENIYENVIIAVFSLDGVICEPIMIVCKFNEFDIVVGVGKKRVLGGGGVGFSGYAQ